MTFAATVRVSGEEILRMCRNMLNLRNSHPVALTLFQLGHGVATNVAQPGNSSLAFNVQ